MELTVARFTTGKRTEKRAGVNWMSSLMHMKMMKWPKCGAILDSLLPQWHDDEHNLSVSMYRLPYTGDSDSEDEDAEVDESRFKVMRFETPLDAGHTLKKTQTTRYKLNRVMRFHPSWTQPDRHGSH